MRLLNVDTFEFSDFFGVTPPPYVIASHRWSGTEASWKDIVKKINTSTTGYRKVQGFARYMKTHLPQVKWLWLDSCCIMQRSDKELSEALNSMFRWYHEAEVCLAWLEDVPTAADPIDQSVWFRRGWTLQELLAPDLVVLLSRDWQVIGHRGKSGYGRSGIPIHSGPSLEGPISRITGIPEDILHSYDASKDLDEEAKFSWMNGRETLRGEDMSYCLLGIMEVNMNVRYGDGEEKTRERLLRKITKRKGLAPPGQFDVPFSLHGIPDTAFFAARDFEIEQLVNYFTLPSAGFSQRRIFVLHGMGGMGKTQLCAHFTKSNATKFSAVFWLDGSSKDGLLRAMASAVGRLPIGACATGEQSSEGLIKWLSLPGNTNWLMVIDNVDRDWQHGNDPDAYDYQKLIPQANHGNILITTRLSRLQRPSASLHVGSVDNSVAQTIIEKRMGQAVDGIDELLQKLGGLPLALAQAGAYLKATGMTVPEYVQHYETTWEELMQYQDQFPPQEYPERSLLTTWKISYRQVESVNPLAARILDLWAFLDHRDIWPELVLAGQIGEARDRPPKCRAIPTAFLDVNKLAVQQSIGVLVQYSLVTPKSATQPHSLHPVVHAWCMHNMESTTVRQEMLTMALWLVSSMTSSRQSGTRGKSSKRTLRLAAHIKAVGHRAEDLADDTNVSLDCTMAAAGLALSEHSGEVEKLYLHALRTFETAGDDGPLYACTLFCYRGLGELYRVQDRLAESETMLEQSLRGLTQSGAEGERDWLSTVNSLALLYTEQGRLADAEKLFQRAMAVQEKKSGADKEWAIWAVRLANLYYEQGKVSESDAMLQRSKQAHGANNSAVSAASGRTGRLYSAQDRSSETEGMVQGVMNAIERAYGADHHKTLAAAYAIGELYHDHGRIEEALAQYQRALAGFEKLPWYPKEKKEKVKQSIENAQREMADTRARRSKTEELVLSRLRVTMNSIFMLN